MAVTFFFARTEKSEENKTICRSHTNISSISNLRVVFLKLPFEKDFYKSENHIGFDQFN